MFKPLFDLDPNTVMYEKEEPSTLFGVLFSSYFWGEKGSSMVAGPFTSAANAIRDYEKHKAYKEANPNVIHVDFKRKARLPKPI